MATISPLMAEALERARERFNARVVAARKAGSLLEVGAFLDHLRDSVGPIIDRVGETRPERVGVVLEALFDVSVELFAATQLGPGAKSRAVQDVWTQVLPMATGLLVRDPARVAGALSNAAVNLSSSPGARPAEWMAALVKVVAVCDDVGELLEAGKVSAWMAGMAQYRVGALAALKGLSAPVASVVLELPEMANADDVERVASAMLSDPWLAPRGALGPGQREVRLLARAGAFRGFGGEFLRPPRAWSAGGHLYVSDGSGTWRLIADRFGHVLVREALPPAEAPAAAAQEAVRLAADGTLTWDDERVRFADLAASSGSAAGRHTVAVTLPSSHHVFLIGRAAVEDARGRDGN